MESQTDAEPSCSLQKNKLKRFQIYLKKIFTKDIDTGLQELIEGREDAQIPLTDDEKELVEAALNFSGIDAGEACVPRSDIIHLSKKDSFDDVISTFKTSGFSRLPVCGKDLDEVLGFVTLKDVFQCMAHNQSCNLKMVMRRCTLVPEGFSISAVLDEMRHNAVQMAIVVDEYGGTTGLITVKDIMEKLVGDLDDENKQGGVEGIVDLLEGRYQLDARMEIEDLSDEMKRKLGVYEGAEYETIGGFILEIAGKVPEEGAAFELTAGGKLIVTKADGRRIYKVTYSPSSTS